MLCSPQHISGPIPSHMSLYTSSFGIISKQEHPSRMCYGNSIINTCPHCTIVDQTFEFHGCHSGSTPTETWWILPSAILEDVWLEDPCDSCSHLYGWLEDLPSSTSDYLLTESNSADEESAEQHDDADEDFLASVSTNQSWDEDPEEHLMLICTWYEDIERYLNSIKASIPSMRARCVATRDVALITRLGLLEANIQMTLTDAAEKLEHYIEVSTWLRQCTTDEKSLRDTEPEEIRAAMFEMRLIFIECESEEGCSDAVTERLGNLATEVWYAMGAAEGENEKGSWTFRFHREAQQQKKLCRQSPEYNYLLNLYHIISILNQ